MSQRPAAAFHEAESALMYGQYIGGGSQVYVAGLFVGIRNWEGIDKCYRGRGGGVNFHEAQIYTPLGLKKP